MIRPDDIFPLLLEACPGFRTRWEEHLALWEGESPGLYIALAEFAAYLGESFRQNEMGTVRATSSLLERLIEEGDENTKEYAIIGLIEELMKYVARDDLLPYLGPQTKHYWIELERFWKRVEAHSKNVR